jgi:glucan phosphoethanolaminetransferase (alkaline phosphatase superfamily)
VDPPAKARPLLIHLAWFALATIVFAFGFNYLEYGHLASWTVVTSLRSSRGMFEVLVYLGTYVVSVAAIVAALFCRWRIARGAALAVVFVGLGLELCCRRITGDNIGFSQVHTFLTERTYTGEFLSSYAASVATALLLTAAVCGVLYAAVRFTRLRLAPAWLGLVPLAAALIYGVLWKTVAFTDVYPSPLRVPVLAAYVSLNRLYTGPRQPVELVARDAPRPRVLIFIVDESVRGDYLGINGFPEQTTPYLESLADGLLNFGVACAAANISSDSNMILQSGIRVEDCPDRAQRSLKLPTVFQYARAAGYRTCFLDAQTPSGELSNYMRPGDLADVDVHYQVLEDPQAEQPRYHRDELLVERIKQIVAEGDPVYIYVNKYGAHFHYESTYPPEARVFQPTMDPQRPIDASTPQEVANSYANAVLWSVDHFFRLLLPALDPRDTVVLYTSDHGQSFKERRGVSTHGDRVDPPATQANVPLLAWGDLVTRRFPDGVGPRRDRLDHFRLFPTQLILMGYEQRAVQLHYGLPLWADSFTDRTFLSGDLYGRGIVEINAFDDGDAP